MAKGLKKGPIFLLIALIIVLITSLVVILTKVGIHGYEEITKGNKTKVNKSIETIENTEDVTEDITEDIVVNKELDSEEFKSNLYAFYEDGLHGFKNSYGEVIISPKYSFLTGEYSEGLIPAYIDGRFGYIDRDENLVIENKYDYAYEFKNGMAIVELDDSSQAVIDKSGKELFATKSYELLDIVGDYILATEGNNNYGVGYLNKKGEEVIPLIYDIARDFSEGYTVLYSEKDGAKLINKELEEIEVDNRRFFQKYFDLTNGFIVGEDRETFEIMVLDKGFNSKVAVVL